MGIYIRRREFFVSLGGAAAWPLAARAQQAERMRRIGVLMNSAADDPEAQARIAAFLQGLQQLGWTDGRNVRIDTRWGAGDAERFADMRRNWSRSRRTSSWPLARLDHGAVATGDPHRADRVRAGRRSGRRRLRRQPGAAGRQRHRLHAFEYGIEREMAGTAQGDRAGRDASGGLRDPGHHRRDRPVAPIQSVAPSLGRGGEPGQRARCRARSSAPSRHSRARSNGGLIVTGERAGDRFIAI